MLRGVSSPLRHCRPCQEYPDTCPQHWFFVQCVIQETLGTKRQNKMKPTNPNADTYVKRSKQYLWHLVTFSTVHSYLTLTWHYTLVGHTLTWHFSRTLWLDALYWQFSGTLWLDTPFWHFCKTLWLDTLVGHSYLLDTFVGHSCFAKCSNATETAAPQIIHTYTSSAHSIITAPTQITHKGSSAVGHWQGPLLSAPAPPRGCLPTPPPLATTSTANAMITAAAQITHTDTSFANAIVAGAAQIHLTPSEDQSGSIHAWESLSGLATHANGCRRLRTVASGCGHKRKFWRTQPYPQTPKVKREPSLCIRERLQLLGRTSISHPTVLGFGFVLCWCAWLRMIWPLPLKGWPVVSLFGLKAGVQVAQCFAFFSRSPAPLRVWLVKHTLGWKALSQSAGCATGCGQVPGAGAEAAPQAPGLASFVAKIAVPSLLCLWPP